MNQVCAVDDKVAPDEHKHVCPRCKTCWRHNDDTQYAETDEEFDEAHTCPRCRQANVTKKVMDDAEKAKSLARLAGNDQELEDIILRLIFGGRR